MMLSFIPHDFHPKFDQWFRLFVKEEIELSHQSKTIKHVSRNSELKNLELAISNVVSLLSTGDLIKGIGDVPVKVNLIDSHTKDVVKSGPEASGKVEIVVVEAEADNRVNDLKNILVLRKGQFEMISQERERRKHSCRGGRRNRSARVNKICLKLIEGTAVLPTVSFVREKKWMKISNLRLQARFMDDFKGIQVKEAQTEPFTLKDCRIQASKKHVIPSLDDDICQLDEVDKVGLLDRSLTEARIKPMGDYIDRLYLYPQHLEEEHPETYRRYVLRPSLVHCDMCAKIKGHLPFKAYPFYGCPNWQIGALYSNQCTKVEIAATGHGVDVLAMRNCVASLGRSSCLLKELGCVSIPLEYRVRGTNVKYLMFSPQ